jgi:hypothetical protein
MCGYKREKGTVETVIRIPPQQLAILKSFFTGMWAKPRAGKVKT